MKKPIALTLALALALSIAMLAGCGGGSASGGNTPAPPSAAADNSTSADNGNASGAGLNGTIGGTQFGVMQDGWPSALVPDLPDYPGDNQRSYAQMPDGSINIVVGDAGQDGFDAYLKTLTDAGWTVSPDDYTTTAQKGVYSVEMQLMGGTNLSCTVTQAAAGAWPSPDSFPVPCDPPTGYTLIDLETDQGDSGDYSLDFGVVGMDAAAAQDYLSGFDFSHFEWNGQTYGWQCDDNYADGPNWVFLFSINLAN